MYLHSNYKVFVVRFVDEFADMHIRGLFANVTILPETMMNDPLYGSETTSLSKFRYNDNMKPKLRQMCSASLSWPLFVYDMYDTQAIVVKIKSFLSAMQIGNKIIIGNNYVFAFYFFYVSQHYR